MECGGAGTLASAKEIRPQYCAGHRRGSQLTRILGEAVVITKSDVLLLVCADSVIYLIRRHLNEVMSCPAFAHPMSQILNDPHIGQVGELRITLASIDIRERREIDDDLRSRLV